LHLGLLIDFPVAAAGSALRSFFFDHLNQPTDILPSLSKMAWLRFFQMHMFRAWYYKSYLVSIRLECVLCFG
jgi:hypothetical protein